MFPNNMVLRRSSVLAFGGFDERFGPGEAAEDNEFSYRWLRAGHSIRYEPALVVWHHDWRDPDELRRLYVAYARGQDSSTPSISGAVTSSCCAGSHGICTGRCEDRRPPSFGAVRRGRIPVAASFAVCLAASCTAGASTGARRDPPGGQRGGGHTQPLAAPRRCALPSGMHRKTSTSSSSSSTTGPPTGRARDSPSSPTNGCACCDTTSRGARPLRATGAAVARGTWLAFLDDDDLWAPRKLRLQLDAASASGAGWAMRAPSSSTRRCERSRMTRSRRPTRSPADAAWELDARRGLERGRAHRALRARRRLRRVVGHRGGLGPLAPPARNRAACGLRRDCTRPHGARAELRRPRMAEGRSRGRAHDGQVPARHRRRPPRCRQWPPSSSSAGRRLEAARMYLAIAFRYRSLGNVPAAGGALLGDRGLRLASLLLLKTRGVSHLELQLRPASPPQEPAGWRSTGSDISTPLQQDEAMIDFVERRGKSPEPARRGARCPRCGRRGDRAAAYEPPRGNRAPVPQRRRRPGDKRREIVAPHGVSTFERQLEHLRRYRVVDARPPRSHEAEATRRTLSRGDHLRRRRRRSRVACVASAPSCGRACDILSVGRVARPSIVVLVGAAAASVRREARRPSGACRRLDRGRRSTSFRWRSST